MRTSLSTAILAFAIASAASWPLSLQAAGNADVRTHPEQSFDQLKQHATPPGAHSALYSPDQYWIGKGQGDLAKGKTMCQRVSELSARTDLAKQIRVMVKEHMVDRVRERSGRDAEQDIELTREEIVQEYLLGVMIVDRHIDEENKVCTATAVMPKTPLARGPAADSDRGLAPR